MKATWEFDLSKLDDWDTHKVLLEAGDVKAALYEFENKLRGIYKYEEHNDEVHAMVERIRGLFYDNLGEYL